jgi:hypothetical protein
MKPGCYICACSQFLFFIFFYAECALPFRMTQDPSLVKSPGSSEYLLHILSFINLNMVHCRKVL